MKVKRFDINVRDSDFPKGGCSAVLDTRKVMDGDIPFTRVKTITVRYDWTNYLADETVDRTHTTKNPKGWTPTELRTVIRKDYRMFERRKMLWGHCVGDLFIEGVKYNPTKKLVTFFTGS